VSARAANPVLLVGGSGFIGQRLSAALVERGRSVRNFDTQDSPVSGVETVIGDVLDVGALAAAARGCDSIINLAAVHRDDVRPVSRYEEVNVGGAHSVVAAAEARGIRHITFTSSVAIYGLDKHNVTEDSVPEPFNEYGRTKLLAEEVFQAWVTGAADRTLTIVRPSVVFGEGNRGNVYTLARQVASGRFLMIGGGTNAKSMSYVGNIAEYLADTVETPATSTVNYADKPDLSTSELVAAIRASLGAKAGRRLSVPLPVGLAAGYAFDAIARVTGRTFPISAVRVRKFVADTSVNTDRLQATGYRPRYDLRDAVGRTVRAEFGAPQT